MLSVFKKGDGFLKLTLENRFIDKYEEITCSIALALSVIILFVNVVMRYCFSTGFAWSDESVRYLIFYVTMVGLGLGIRNNATISVDLALQLVSDSKKKNLYLIINTVQILFGGVLLFSSWKLIYSSWMVNEHTLAMDIPIVIPYAPFIIGALLIIYRSSQQILIILKNSREVL